MFFQNSYVAALQPSNSVCHLSYGGPICNMGTITPTSQGHREMTDAREPCKWNHISLLVITSLHFDERDLVELAPYMEVGLS